jgi:M6 family metalloprotease-like protein
MRAIVPALLAALLCHGAGRAADLPAPGSVPLAAPVARRLAARSEVLRAESRNAVGLRLPGEKAPAALEAIVISCDFADSLLLGRYGQVPGDFPPPTQTDRHYAAHDSVFLHHKLQDVAAYFADASGGALDIRFTVHARAVNLPHTMSFYGNHPTFGEQPVSLAAAVVDSLDQEIDFTRYDTVVLVHAGAGEETDILGDSPEQIYSTYLNPDDFTEAFEEGQLAQPYLAAAGFAPGTGIDRVLVLPETEQQDPFGGFGGGFGSLGVYCFEFGLHLGMLSLSDFTPSGYPDSQGVGQYDLMGYGLFVGLGFLPPQPGPLNKLLMGWVRPFTADAEAGVTWKLAPASDVAGPFACARVDINGQEYWLAEYRLQDPNGDRRYSFPGDLNGNGLPDFWDDDSANGDGTPTGLFDPETDTHEDLRGAEWDFAMSENNAREYGELAAGSGVYVWHVDEAVIAEVFGGPTNLFNADPARKAVDLEEADGIQDLDTSEPSDWQLGGDDDSFRGEDNARFGPDTRPDTRANGDWPTGVVMSDFSNVVLDSAAYVVVVGSSPYPGYDYADTMSFRLERAPSNPDARQPAARVSLPAGTDLSGSHLMAVDLDGAGGQEIVVADRHGSVWAFTGDLAEFLDRDFDGTTLEPLASGWRAGGPASWHLPAAAGDLDGDGVPEIVLTTPDGLYAFHTDGSPLREAEIGAVGLYADVPGCSLPPVLLAADPEAERGEPGAQVSAVVAWARDGACGLDLFSGAGAERGQTIELGPGYVASPPQLFGTRLLVCVADTAAGAGWLAVVDPGALPLPANPEVIAFPLAIVPGSWPPVAGLVPGSDPLSPQAFVMVVSGAGEGVTVVLDAGLDRVAADYRWPAGFVVAGPPSPGGALASDGQFGRVGQVGDWLAGWPRSESPAAATGPGAALVARIVDAPDGYDHYLFTAADGRLVARGARGEDVPGWPLGGPGTSAGTPALGGFGGGAEADLAAAGSFPRIVGNADDGERLVTRAVSEIVVWHDVAGAAVLWPMWGGSAWRSGAWDAANFAGVPAVSDGTGLVPGSHFCYPNPLSGDVLQVRAQLRQAGRALVTIHDLSGEQVATSSWQAVAGVEPFSLDVDLATVASGMYLCRLVVESDGGGSDVSVVTFAVAH